MAGALALVVAARGPGMLATSGPPPPARAARTRTNSMDRRIYLCSRQAIPKRTGEELEFVAWKTPFENSEKAVTPLILVAGGDVRHGIDAAGLECWEKDTHQGGTEGQADNHCQVAGLEHTECSQVG